MGTGRIRSSSDARLGRARGRTAHGRFRTARRAVAGSHGGANAPHGAVTRAPIVVGAVADGAVAESVESGHEAHGQAAWARRLCMGAGPTSPAAYPEAPVIAARRPTINPTTLAAPLLKVPLLKVA